MKEDILRRRKILDLLKELEEKGKQNIDSYLLVIISHLFLLYFKSRWFRIHLKESDRQLMSVTRG